MSSPLASLLSMLDLDEVEPGRAIVTGGLLDGEDVTVFEGPCDDFGNEHMIGGHVLAQAIVAAGRTVGQPTGSDRRLHSIHAYFLRPGDVHEPITFVVEHTRDGGSFSARSVHAIQHGRRIFTGNASFQSPFDGLHYQDPVPVTPGPEGIPTTVERLEEARADMTRQSPPSPAWGAIEELHVSPDVFLVPSPDRSPDQASWLRASGPMPDDPLLHAAVTAYASDLSLLMPAVRRHGLSTADPVLRMATIDHALWFHRPLRIDEWVLSHLHTPTSQDGRAIVAGHIFQDGQLVASVTREGLFRTTSGQPDLR